MVARARPNACRPREACPGGAGAQVELETTLEEAGSRLAGAYLPREVSDAMAAAIAEAERLNGTLQLALSVAEPFADLPWETICLPRIGALALHPRIAPFRQVKTDGAAPAVAVPGPLRILVAIGSPEAQNQRGELLDMEAELRRILDATDAAQRSGRAFVRILEQGSVAAILAALAERSSTSPATQRRVNWFWKMHAAERIASPPSVYGKRRFRHNGRRRWLSSWVVRPGETPERQTGAERESFLALRERWCSMACRRSPPWRPRSATAMRPS
jgi:hypothetical protein